MTRPTRKSGRDSLRILHVIERLSVSDGGPPRACREMSRALAERGHEVTIFTTDKVEPDEAPLPPHEVTPAGVTIRAFPAGPFHHWRRSPAMAAALHETLASTDIVCGHGLYCWHSKIVPEACRATGVPYIVRPLGTLDPYIRNRRRVAKAAFDAWFQRRALAEAAALHFTTELERDLARPVLPPVGNFVLPLGIFARDGASSSASSVMSRQPDRLTLLFLGRLHEKKGIKLLLRAVSRLAGRYPALRLVIRGPDAGEGPHLRAIVTSLGLGERVTIDGFADDAEKARLFTEADLFVLPSHSENFGITVVEAMAAGVPVLVSDKVNLHTEVGPAGAGWVCPPTVDALTETLNKALADPDVRETAGDDARAFARERYDWGRIAGKLERIYRTIARDGRLVGSVVPE